MAENQCACYGRTPDWKCKILSPIGTPTPYFPQGTQPGFIEPCGDCGTGFCAQHERKVPCSEKVPDKLIFVMEWYDRESDLIKKYTLTYHNLDKTSEMCDLINHRRFLKRHLVDNVTLDNLIPGNVINIYGRQMTVVQYADSCTQQYLEPKHQRAFLMIRPHAVQCLGQIYEMLDNNFRILRCRMAWFTKETAELYYQEHNQKQAFFDSLIRQVTSAPVVVFLLVGENAIERLMEMAGPADPAEAKLKDPSSLRAIYGENTTRCGVEVSETPGCAARDSSFFFTDCRLLLPTLAPGSVMGKCSTLGIIKPHAVKKGVAGKIMYDIARARFQITGMELFYLDRTHAEEHYEIYRGVLNEFSSMTEELSLGPCIVMEISGCGEDTPKAFREFCGPADPILARKLRPNSLRAKYGGTSRVMNAVHCTDLPCDAEMEVQYFFKILQMLE